VHEVGACETLEKGSESTRCHTAITITITITFRRSLSVSSGRVCIDSHFGGATTAAATTASVYALFAALGGAGVGECVRPSLLRRPPAFLAPLLRILNLVPITLVDLLLLICTWIHVRTTGKDSDSRGGQEGGGYFGGCAYLSCPCRPLSASAC
jgi:hypothetical protein